MEMQKPRICKECVIDENTYQGVTFNESGTSYYYLYIKYWLNAKYRRYNENFLNNFLDKILKRSKGQKYNAIVGISGGMDSCFLAYQCKQWNLRVLLVHMDNHWNTKVAEHNINQITRITGFDLIDTLLIRTLFLIFNLPCLNPQRPTLKIRRTLQFWGH